MVILWTVCLISIDEPTNPLSKHVVAEGFMCVLYGLTAGPYTHTHTTDSKFRCQTPTKHTTKYL